MEYGVLLRYITTWLKQEDSHPEIFVHSTHRPLRIKLYNLYIPTVISCYFKRCRIFTSTRRPENLLGCIFHSLSDRFVLCEVGAKYGAFYITFSLFLKVIVVESNPVLTWGNSDRPRTKNLWCKQAAAFFKNRYDFKIGNKNGVLHIIGHILDKKYPFFHVRNIFIEFGISVQCSWGGKI